MLVCECTQLPLSKCGGHEIICGCMLFPAIWFQDSNAGSVGGALPCWTIPLALDMAA